MTPTSRVLIAHITAPITARITTRIMPRRAPLVTVATLTLASLALSTCVESNSERCLALTEAECDQDPTCAPLYATRLDPIANCVAPNAFAGCGAFDIPCKDRPVTLATDDDTCFTFAKDCYSPSSMVGFSPSTECDALAAQLVSDKADQCPAAP